MTGEEFSEPSMTINGTRLTPEQARAMRTGLIFLSMCVSPERAAADDCSKQVALEYLQSVREINQLIYPEAENRRIAHTQK